MGGWGGEGSWSGGMGWVASGWEAGEEEEGRMHTHRYECGGASRWCLVRSCGFLWCVCRASTTDSAQYAGRRGWSTHVLRCARKRHGKKAKCGWYQLQNKCYEKVSAWLRPPLPSTPCFPNLLLLLNPLCRPSCCGLGRRSRCVSYSSLVTVLTSQRQQWRLMGCKWSRMRGSVAGVWGAGCPPSPPPPWPHGFHVRVASATKFVAGFSTRM